MYSSLPKRLGNKVLLKYTPASNKIKVWLVRKGRRDMVGWLPQSYSWYGFVVRLEGNHF